VYWDVAHKILPFYLGGKMWFWQPKSGTHSCCICQLLIAIFEKIKNFFITQEKTWGF
jgi:hypothetical protein